MILRQCYFFILSLFKSSWRLEYDGEFGYELISVLPFAYWLHQRGKQVTTISSKDTKALYYFSDRHQEHFKKRLSKRAAGVPVSNIHRRWMNTWCWSPPPLKETYINDRFIFEKPTLIICNKFNSEWGNPPITFLSVEILDQILNKLTQQFQIIYCRPGAHKIIDDNSDVYELKDHEFIKKLYPDVILIEDLHEANPDLSFNELQLMCFSNANHFISVQGGYSIFCSYFKGTNIIYGARSKARTADEISYKAFDRWYHKFSGSKIHYADTYQALSQLINQHVYL